MAVCASGRLSDVERLRWETNFDLVGGWLPLPGTKTTLPKRKMKLPKTLLYCLRENEQDSGPVVERWINVRRDLEAAYQRAGIREVTPERPSAHLRELAGGGGRAALPHRPSDGAPDRKP